MRTFFFSATAVPAQQPSRAMSRKSFERVFIFDQGIFTVSVSFEPPPLPLSEPHLFTRIPFQQQAIPGVGPSRAS